MVHRQAFSLETEASIPARDTSVGEVDFLASRPQPATKQTVPFVTFPRVFNFGLRASVMSLPSKYTAPSVGSVTLTSNRPVVVLPPPLSPARPKITPFLRPTLIP